MKKILLVHLPFCTPASPAYSITYLYSFLKNNSKINPKINIDFLDLNLEFHKLRFPEFQKYYQDINNWKDYDKKTAEYNRLTSKTYSENNKKVVNGKKPELFDLILKKITDKKPDIVAFSIVYSSQAFYAYSLIKELKESKQIMCFIGGPAINDKLSRIADKTLNNEIELLNAIEESKIKHEDLNFKFHLDFSIYNLNEYFTPYPVIPLKTSSSCYYKQCAFCTHFSKIPYYELNIENIRETIIHSRQKYFFLVDDMIHAKRLMKIAKIFRPLNIKWTCQLRPTKELSLETLKILRESGLTMIMWGVESGNDRILKLIRKGTNKKDIEMVLKNSHDAGIKNVVYMLFGFPTETKEEFFETIEFLKTNEKNIDLVSVSVFGLQKGSAAYNNPEKFGISEIHEEKRTILEPKITYDVKTGLSKKEVGELREKYKKTIDNINKYPKTMNYFREHMFCIIG
ncbi:MAG: B12-binding domain-containing radical SAM protein [Candidatus Woesearchaeota archaeon]